VARHQLMTNRANCNHSLLCRPSHQQRSESTLWKFSPEGWNPRSTAVVALGDHILFRTLFSEFKVVADSRRLL